ncbi:glycoside hydrolase domain-containing protein [Bradyrhizobium ganzhouense]|uniref:glycoside hydrolase domain-containing protein n=1 Tax=Bradyrhizobium ganzhouense TaxID=1179767 RepID=UPI003CE6CDE3
MPTFAIDMLWLVWPNSLQTTRRKKKPKDCSRRCIQPILASQNSTVKDCSVHIARHLFVVLLASAAFGAQAAPLEYPGERPSCTGKSKFPVFDISMPVHTLSVQNGKKSMLDALRDDFKVNTIIRYYDDPDNPTLAGKILKEDESTAILHAKFKIAVVFQHKSHSVSKFQDGEGTKDAGFAWNLAEKNKQPYKTAIYFGIDGPFEEDELRQRFGDGKDDELIGKMRLVVKTYFQEIQAAFASFAKKEKVPGYDIGIYCSAEMCSVGDDLKLPHMWVSAAGRDSDYFKKLMAKPAKVNLLQSRESLPCDGWVGVPHGQDPTFDIDQVNDGNPNLGTWDRKRK